MENTKPIKTKADVTLMNKSINEYYQELNNDLTINLLNLRERSLSISAIRAKWIMYLFKEKENLKRYKKKKSEITAKLIEVMNKDPNKRSIINRKMEDEINSKNPSMIKLNNTIEELQEIIQFLELSTNVLNDYGFTVKNTIDTLKLEQV